MLSGGKQRAKAAVSAARARTVHDGDAVSRADVIHVRSRFGQRLRPTERRGQLRGHEQNGRRRCDRLAVIGRWRTHSGGGQVADQARVEQRRATGLRGRGELSARGRGDCGVWQERAQRRRRQPGVGRWPRAADEVAGGAHARRLPRPCSHP